MKKVYDHGPVNDHGIVCGACICRRVYRWQLSCSIRLIRAGGYGISGYQGF
ncbi:MAG TPA: hypothetical protein IAA06_06370 [Candidatus Blautia faecavium]|uniref:Uncharacterized protein n=1 Tax=Candidatus Blautia faecavium TaxID=2838487 RepID=A0A9D2LS26_9FIRM|nr:hypothetical protein [Candidatus Blautia faecavium]